MARLPPPADPSCCTPLSDLLSPRLFKALSDPRRVSLLVELAQADAPLTVSEIAGKSGVDLSVVSRHLALLRDAGIIQCRRQGREVRCSVRAAEVAALLRELADALLRCCPPGAAVPPRPAALARGRSARAVRPVSGRRSALRSPGLSR